MNDYKMVYRFIKNSCLLVLILIIGCLNACKFSEDSISDIPIEAIESEDITVYEKADLKEDSTIQFEKDEVIAGNDSLYLGYIGDIAVHDEHGIFLYDGHQSAKAIYQFTHSGDYVRKIGRVGKGPGEYLSGSKLDIVGDILMVFDRKLIRALQYSVESGNKLKTTKIDPPNIKSPDSIAELRVDKYRKLRDDLYLLSFIRAQRYYEEEPGQIRYFITDSEFKELSAEIFRLNLQLQNFGEWQGRQIMYFYPFHTRPFLTVSESGRIFTAVSDQFFIRELNYDGETVGGFYYPYERRLVNRREVFSDIHEREKNIVENMPVPDYWPVLEGLIADDENRLWIATVTDEEAPQKWYVMESTGEFVGTFSWPRESTLRLVKNRFLYAVENNSETGLSQLVRYQIKL